MRVRVRDVSLAVMQPIAMTTHCVQGGQPGRREPGQRFRGIGESARRRRGEFDMMAQPGHPAQSTHRRSLSTFHWSRRVFWFCLLLLHVPAVPSVWEEVAAGGDAAPFWAVLRLAGLCASAVFFVLKVIDLPWLRLKPGPRAAVTAVLIVALLHVGVVERTIQAETELSPARAGLVLFAGTVWPVEGLKRGLKLVPRVVALARSACTDRQLRGHVYCRQLWESVLQPAARFVIPSYRGPRAPPCPLATT